MLYQLLNFIILSGRYPCKRNAETKSDNRTRMLLCACTKYSAEMSSTPHDLPHLMFLNASKTLKFVIVIVSFNS